MEYCLPIAVRGWQNAENIETLLQKKVLQIGLNEKELVKLSGGYVILDFGKELSGGVRILTYSVKGPGSVRIRFGESLGECCADIGYKNATNDHSTRDFIMQLQNYSDMTFGQTGFRFVRIDCLDAGTELEIKNIWAAFDLPKREPVGAFVSDDEEVNRIFDIAAWTLNLCRQNGYFWDGVKRDRLVWIGDLYPEMRAAHCLFGTVPEITASLDFARQETDLPGWMNGYPTYSLWWTIILADEVVRFGTREPKKEEIDYLEKLLTQIMSCVSEEGDVVFPDGFVFIDWPSLCRKDSEPEKWEDFMSGVRALTVIAMDKALGIPGLSKAAKAICCEVRKRVNRKERPVRKLKQMAALCTIAGDKTEQNRQVMLANGASGLSTFMSYPILTAMTRYGDYNQAFRIMKEYYGGMLRMGATTFWEDFDLNWMENATRIDEFPQEGKKDIHGDFGGYCYEKYRHSLCHGWSAGVIAYLMESVAGIREVGDEGRAIEIQPHLSGLRKLDVTYPTRSGILKVSYKTDEDGKVSFDYEAPEGVRVKCC